MATLEEASARLTQPAKDLADWNYPFAKNLENYSTAVQETTDINFSNAGLVIQNATNVYVRRVEYLYQDATGCARSFAEHEAAEQSAKQSRKDGKSKQKFNFDDFKLIDFTELIGRNINGKVRSGTTTSIRLLSQRFPQLENISGDSFPVMIYDMHNEEIGKKYDFRLNQYWTASGMLVEHLTPEDFRKNFAPEESTTIASEVIETRVDVTTEHSDSGNEEDTEVRESLSGVENSDVSHVIQEKETDAMDVSSASYADSGLGTSLQTPDISMRPESSLSCDHEVHWDTSQSRAGSSLSVVDESNPEAFGNSQDIASIEKNSEMSNSSQNVSSVERNSDVMKCSLEETSEPVIAEKSDESLQRNNSDENRTIQESENTAAFTTARRRSKRIKNVIDAINDLNPKPWEPIPFDSIPDKIPENKAEFKLPCPVSLLKVKNKPRKRKNTPAKKKNSPTATLKNEGGLRKKLKMYSPTNQIFPSFNEDTSEAELYFKNQLIVDVVHYEAVTTLSDDLIGYTTNLQKSDNDTIAGNEASINKEPWNNKDLDGLSYEAVTDVSTDLSESQTTSKPSLVSDGKTSNNSSGTINDVRSSTPEAIDTMDDVIDDFPMPDTPESSTSSDRLSTPTPLPDLHSRIERSVREINDHLDFRTAQEKAVAEWHELMKPKFREAELRPTFVLEDYSRRVMENLRTSENNRIRFEELVQERAGTTEISRYFWTSLLLAKDGDVLIETGNDVEGNLTLVLPDKDRPSNK